jgi:hypothetical protein
VVATGLVFADSTPQVGEDKLDLLAQWHRLPQVSPKRSGLGTRVLMHGYSVFK